LAASKKAKTSRRASRQDTKMYTFCESSQTSMGQNPRLNKKIIEAEGEFKKVLLDSRVPDKTISIGAEAS
jgi:hypothetical protein